MYYSFYSNKDERRVLAVANFDRAGKMTGQVKELITSTGTTNRKTGFFRVKYFDETGITVVVELEYLYLNELTPFRPQFRVLALDAADKKLTDQKVDWDDYKSCTFQSFATDKSGNVFLHFYRDGGKQCPSVFLTVNATGIEEWCEPERSKGFNVVNDNGVWIMDGQGNQHHMDFLADKKTDLVGVILQSFEKSDGARTFAKEYTFKGNYPPTANPNSQNSPSMKTCRVSKVTFKEASTLTIYGYEYLMVITVLELDLNLDSGFEKPDVCITKRIIQQSMKSRIFRPTLS